MPRRLGSVAVLSLLLIISSIRAAPPDRANKSRPFSQFFLRHAVAANTYVSRLALEPFYLDASMSRVLYGSQSSASQFSCFSGRAEAVVLLW